MDGRWNFRNVGGTRIFTRGLEGSVGWETGACASGRREIKVEKVIKKKISRIGFPK